MPDDHANATIGLIDGNVAPDVLNAEERLGISFPAIEHSPCAALRAANRAVSQLYDLVLSPTGLKATQFVILHAIYEKGEIAQCEFARNHAVAVETLSRRFSGLRSKGYIQVRTGDRHGERIYSLTQKGREVLIYAGPYWERAQERLRKMLGENDWRATRQLMDRVRIAALGAVELRTENQLHGTAKSKCP